MLGKLRHLLGDGPPDVDPDGVEPVRRPRATAGAGATAGPKGQQEGGGVLSPVDIGLREPSGAELPVDRLEAQDRGTVRREAKGILGLGAVAQLRRIEQSDERREPGPKVREDQRGPRGAPLFADRPGRPPRSRPSPLANSLPARSRRRPPRCDRRPGSCRARAVAPAGRCSRRAASTNRPPALLGRRSRVGSGSSRSGSARR